MSELPHILSMLPSTEKHTKIARFWDSLKKHKLTTVKCNKCNRILWPPRVVCSECHSDQLEWIELKGKGKLYTFTEVRRGIPAGYEQYAPYIFSMVELEEGPRVFAWVLDSKLDDLEIDMEVEAAFKEITPDVTLLVFRPIDRRTRQG